MPISQFPSSLELPGNTPWSVEFLVSDVVEFDDKLDSLRAGLEQSGIGRVNVRRVCDLTKADLVGMPSSVYGALCYGNPTIVDVEGIGNLVQAVPRGDQEFSSADTTKALIEAGLIPDNTFTLKMGASGAVVEGERGAEVIETILLDVRNGLVRAYTLAKAAWSDVDGALHVDSLRDPRRVLLENEFIEHRQPLKESGAVFVEVTIENDDVDLYSLVAKAAGEAGLDNYTLRATIEGSFAVKVAVIKGLPELPLKDRSSVRQCLIQYDKVGSGKFHYVGSRTAQVSRQNDEWGEIMGNNIYAPDGHCHGYAEDASFGGHIVAVKPGIGSKVYLKLEPAKVVRLVKNKY